MMRLFAVFAMLASIGSAAPVAEDGQFKATIIFVGAADGSSSLEVPTDGSEFYISNPLSISHIYSYGGATCGFDGVDGSHTVIVGSHGSDVGPPQTQVKGSCLAF